MKFVDEFRDRSLVKRLAGRIREVCKERYYRIMEVCGTHTMNIFRFGLRELLPENIALVSGPGCPVCVTANEYLDRAIRIASMKNVIIATFGDMMKVPGSRSSLEKEKASGRDIRVVYSSLDALEIARKNRGRDVVFLGVGFETTSPTIAESVLIAAKERIKNYSVLCGHKTMPEALEALARDGDTGVSAFLLPGHVSAIIGSRPYGFLSRVYRKNCVVSGFESVDIMQSILMLIGQKSPAVEIQYKRIISPSGNKTAMAAVHRVFEKCDCVWRGLGRIRGSGLKIRENFARFDAQKRFNPKISPVKEDARCLCGRVLKGLNTPRDCPLFAKTCTPENPVGSCMVSSEGTCAAYYKYNRSPNRGS